MNITLVMDQYDKQNNGTTVTARRLAQALRDDGHTVTILADGAPEEGKICAKKHTIPFFQTLIQSQGMSFAKPDPALYYQAFKDADIVHFFMPFKFSQVGEKYAHQMRVPCIAAFHVQPENITSTFFLNRWTRLNSWLYRYFNKRFYHYFTHIHAPSHFIAQQLEQNGYKAKIHVVSNGVPSSFQHKKIDKPKEWEDKFVILMVGRYSREKRQDVLIEAIKASAYADRIQLVLAGKGPTRHHYARLGKKLPNRPVMRFFQQQELHDVINQSDLYIHSADAEIEGLGAMEAMACGLVPVISDSSLSATSQYALCPQSLFAAGDPKDLAQKIDYWIEHPTERAELSEQYMAAQDANRVSACAAQMVEVYKEVIADHQQPKKKNPRWRPFCPNQKRLDSHLVAACTSDKPAGDFVPSLADVVLAPIDSGLLGLRVEGRRNLKSLEGGAVTVSNHVHILDGPMVKTVFRGRRMWLVSLTENFRIPVAGYFVKALGAVPLESDPDKRTEAVRRLKQRIAAGDLVHYYPEGMLVPYSNEIRPLRDGAFALAVDAGCPVMPLALRLRKGRGLYALKRKPCFTLCVGTPIYPNPELPVDEARREIKDLTRVQMEQMIGAQH